MNQQSVQIISINVGKPKTIVHRGVEVATGIFKSPIEGDIYLSKLNFAGDEQADLVHHGGVDKAVCVYPYLHYPYWEKELGQSLSYGAFGENLTVDGMPEDEVCIGDVYQLGEAVVQVSQPRQPCHKLAKRYDVADLPLKIQDTGYTGFYFRVLQEGMLSKASGIKLLSRHPKKVTVAYANEIMHHDKTNVEGMKGILDVEELSASWRNTFLKRLGGTEVDSQKRLQGE